jgi:4a-hydroxytetrahydrobiopterin dehydratase
MAEPLSKDKIEQALAGLNGWSHENDKLKKEFTFDNFRDAMAFITRLSFEAEEQVHHPELFNVYNTVNIALSTHDAGGKVTEKDLKLAKSIESLYNQ